MSPLDNASNNPFKKSLTEQKQELFKLLLQKKGIQLKQKEIIPRRAPSAENCVSFAQQRLWFLAQLEGASVAYNMPAVLRMKGNLEVACLQNSINAIIQRHEVLRTTFATVNGLPVQAIAPKQDIILPLLDLEGLPPDVQKQEIKRLTLEATQTPFDLEKSSLLRISLLRLHSQEYLLILTMHHIIFDGWSIGVLVRELSTLYPAFLNKEPISLPELPIQYADFAHWQRQWLQGDVLETQLTYWQKQLTGASLLDLPTDYPRPPMQTYRGAKYSFKLPQSLALSLKQFSQSQGVTLFMTLLTAFASLLGRYSSQDDIVIGSPIANRNRPELEGLIGFFANTLALRINLEGDPTFLELLSHVRELAMQAYAHQDLPFEMLVEKLKLERNLSYNPLFQVMFTLQNTFNGELELPGLLISQEEVDSGTVAVDLSLQIWEFADGLSGDLTYNTDLFESSTIARMVSYFQNHLEGIVAHPEQRLSELPLLTVSEQQTLLVEWNNTAAANWDGVENVGSFSPTLLHLCIHQLFEVQVEKTPDSVAVIFEDRQLTYQELNRQGTQLAYYLQKLGVGPEVLVGICTERSPQMIVALLGILKAGGAYVPLDPKYPKERLAFILADANVTVLLTQAHLIKNLPEHKAQVVCLDTDWEKIGLESSNNLVSEVKPDNLGYVIYTSGSTGKPKGVAIEHRSTVALLDWAKKQFAHRALARVLASTSICFDLSVFEIFVPLTGGGKVILVENALHLPTSAAAQEVTLINTVPSAIAELLRIGCIPASVHTINLAGEPLQNKLVQQLYQLDTVEQVFNLYGPSEDTTYSTFAQIPKGANEKPPIGRPITNTQIYLLDKHLQPVPIGFSGELYIGGNGLARGYLNRPDLTAEKFIPNPFRKAEEKNIKPENTSFFSDRDRVFQPLNFTVHPLDRLYKTGDLARYHPDGNIEFIGRLDYQVKIRGFRIELSEIEAAISQHPQVQTAVVSSHEEETGNKYLVAYVVPNNQVLDPKSEIPSLESSDLRCHLRKQLPEYMIPKAFILLETLPLTPNGKVDRKALPVPDSKRPEMEATYIAPRNPVEEVIASIWAQILGLEQVGINDNFFDLGGHSLLATQLISRLCQTFPIELPIKILFENPTIAKLSEAISMARSETMVGTAAPIQVVTRNGHIPLSFAQQRLWFLDRMEEGRGATYNMPTVLHLTGSLQIEALEQGITEIMRRHEVLRTSFPTVQGLPVQAIAEKPQLKLTRVDLQGLTPDQQTAEVHRLATEEAHRPFDLANSPLLRVTLLKLGEQSHVLLVTIHHICSDGWSVAIYTRELSILYQAFSTGTPSPLPELPIQYADFAYWQHQWLKSSELDRQLAYWQQQLQDAPPVLKLPNDYPRKTVQSFRGNAQAFTLAPDLCKELTVLSRKTETTLFMVLFAVFGIVLHYYSGQDDLVLGTDVANRNRAETEGLIGFFVNQLPLRLDFSGNPTFNKEFLGRVRERALEAYANQDLPFDRLVEKLNFERTLSYNPVFQAKLVLQNTPKVDLELPGLTIKRLVVENETASYDLLLNVEETEQGLEGSLRYSTELFKPTTITGILEHFQMVLRTVVMQPDLHLNELSKLLADTDRTKQQQAEQEIAKVSLQKLKNRRRKEG